MIRTLPPKTTNGYADLTDNFAVSLFKPALDYTIDASQRTVLFLDALRKRGNIYFEQGAKTVPHVLNYAVELVLDGRTLKRPVNYGLVRVIPPKGVEIDLARRPFVVVDPRAGHAPGIGGFKADSEIGVAMRAGHPCYFIGFTPDPVPGQTIEDIARAEAVFLEKVIALHPNADGKPCVIGNCQAGWALMMLAAIRPELFGPLIIAGSPLSYWAGVRGKNPMRYSGGLLGGSWLAAMTSDLSGGKFDGAWLVQNFENLNPANTLWTKQYNLYSNIDTEEPRYLDFERWWGRHVSLNAEEIQFIVDELFVGNKLAAAEIRTSEGAAIDLRNIRSPIVVFCSHGDDITPPAQALGWILDLYKDVDEIRSFGQTIVYTVHETAGHLGIFVSGGVARKEHSEFSSNIDLIDVLPPGLYEATFERKSSDTANPELATGDWIMRCEQRSLDDVRRICGSNPSDDRYFATVARLSETNLALYRAFMQPFVRALASSGIPEVMARFHPLRLSYELFSDRNPFMMAIPSLANAVREDRKPVPEGNPFLAAQETISQQITSTLKIWGQIRDQMGEAIFLATYGSPMLQALAGTGTAVKPQKKAAKSTLHRDLLAARVAELRSRISSGGLREAMTRGLIYAGLARGRIDERSVRALGRLRTIDEDHKLTLAQFKSMAREQFLMLLLDEEAALAAIPKMVPHEFEVRKRALGLIRTVLGASGEIKGESAERLERLETLLGISERFRKEAAPAAEEAEKKAEPKATKPPKEPREPARRTPEEVRS